ncbi:hypothetical protein NL676_011124 [Syzygium grande]|nr:hypothetical protein NL676_011124 [Syzygium grande]
MAGSCAGFLNGSGCRSGQVGRSPEVGSPAWRRHADNFLTLSMAWTRPIKGFGWACDRAWGGVYSRLLAARGGASGGFRWSFNEFFNSV